MVFDDKNRVRVLRKVPSSDDTWNPMKSRLCPSTLTNYPQEEIRKQLCFHENNLLSLSTHLNNKTKSEIVCQEDLMEVSRFAGER
jgi:hypothetical protein